VSSASGVLSESGVSTTTLSYLDATSSVQTQINTKASTATPVFTGLSTFNGNISSTGTISGLYVVPTIDVTIATPTVTSVFCRDSSFNVYISTEIVDIKGWKKISP